MRLLCDEMLNRLARWLRAAGYDTVIAAGKADDRALLTRCAAEGGALVTRDRHLAETTGPIPVVRLTGDDIDENARVLRDILGLDWRHAPFTRCLVDNAVLVPAGPEEAERVPATARALGGPLRLCPICGRVYWPGSHARRMMGRLARWRGD